MIPPKDEQVRLQGEFLDRLAERLHAGRREYGDASLVREDAELIGEIEEELLDVAGWAFVLWLRVRTIGQRGGE